MLDRLEEYRKKAHKEKISLEIQQSLISGDSTSKTNPSQTSNDLESGDLVLI